MCSRQPSAAPLTSSSLRTSRTFPATALNRYGLSAVHPDDFLLDQLDLNPVTIDALRRLRAGYRRLTITAERFYAALSQLTTVFAERASAIDLPFDDRPPTR